jgi:hypothetical protein
LSMASGATVRGSPVSSVVPDSASVMIARAAAGLSRDGGGAVAAPANRRAPTGR